MNKDKVLEFLLHESTGMSSIAICDRIIYGDDIKEKHHPSDTNDLGRCVKCLEITGVDISIMKGVSPQWDWLIDRWDELMRSYKDEKTAYPSTYLLMKEILGGF